MRMYQDTIDLFITEDLFELFLVEETNPINLTGATITAWIRNGGGVDSVDPINIVITTLDQTNPNEIGKFTMFVDKSHLPSPSQTYTLRIHITLGGIEKVFYNAKLCLHE